MYFSWYSLSSRALQNRNFFQRNSAHFTLIFMCRTDRRKNPSREARRSAFDQPTTASIKHLFAFCSNKFCSLVHHLRKSLEFPINLLNSFCATGLQGVAHLLTKLSDSKPHEILEALNYSAVEGEQRVQSEECVYSLHHGKCICHHVCWKGEPRQAAQFLSQAKRSAAAGTQGLQGSHFNTCIIVLCICSKSERCFCCHGCFAVLSTEECCHIFHSRQKWKQQVLQNPFFLSLDWAWLLASFLQKELTSVKYCTSWEAALFTQGIKEI